MTRDLFKFSLVAATSVAAGIAIGTVALASQGHTISQKDKKFAPGSIEIAKGDKVVFVNDDSTKHTIIVKKLKYRSKLMKPGEQAELQFDKNGKFKVRCGIHPKMKMTIMVN